MSRIEYRSKACLSNKRVYKELESNVRKIILSKLGKFKDIYSFIDDLTSEGIISVLSSIDKYDSTKSKFSTYSYNRIVSRVGRAYLSMKYSFGGVKSISGRSKKEIDKFLDEVNCDIIQPEEAAFCIEAYNYPTFNDLDKYLSEQDQAKLSEAIKGNLPKKEMNLLYEKIKEQI